MNNVTRYELEIHEGGGEVVTSETGGFVDYDDYLSQLHQTDALQTSLNNIVNAFGIKGEGAHSKLVIEYVHGLVAESEAMKDINAWCRTDAFQNMYREFKIAEAAGCDVIDCMHDAMLTAIMHAPATPKADAFTAELRAQGVDALALHMEFNGYSNEASGAREFAANLRAGRGNE